jgi:hypothetical protein
MSKEIQQTNKSRNKKKIKAAQPLISTWLNRALSIPSQAIPFTPGSTSENKANATVSAGSAENVNWTYGSTYSQSTNLNFHKRHDENKIMSTVINENHSENRSEWVTPTRDNRPSGAPLLAAPAILESTRERKEKENKSVDEQHGPAAARGDAYFVDVPWWLSVPRCS